jgi:MerR family copper efflux transcriptional regulator
MRADNGDEAMLIGDLAARFGLAPHVLRHWEAMGLLTPARRVNGRRLYDSGHITRVALIIRGKQGGLSLEQLRDLLDAPGPDRRHELLRHHHAELQRRVEEISASKTMIEHALNCSSGDFTRCPEFRRLLASTGRPAVNTGRSVVNMEK